MTTKSSKTGESGCLQTILMIVCMLIFVGWKLDNAHDIYRDHGMTGIVLQFLGFEPEKAD